MKHWRTGPDREPPDIMGKMVANSDVYCLNVSLLQSACKYNQLCAQKHYTSDYVLTPDVRCGKRQY